MCLVTPPCNLGGWGVKLLTSHSRSSSVTPCFGYAQRVRSLQAWVKGDQTRKLVFSDRLWMLVCETHSVRLTSPLGYVLGLCCLGLEIF